MHRADAEIGRPGGAHRPRRRAPTSQSRRSPTRAKRCAATPKRLRNAASGHWRGDRQRAVNAVDGQAMAADRQFGRSHAPTPRRHARRGSHGGRLRRPRRAAGTLRPRFDPGLAAVHPAAAQQASSKRSTSEGGDAAPAPSRRGGGSGFRAPQLRCPRRARAWSGARFSSPARRRCACRRRPTIPRQFLRRSASASTASAVGGPARRPPPAAAREDEARAGVDSRWRSAMATVRSGASGSWVSRRTRHAMPARGSCRRSSTSSPDRFMASSTRSTPSSCGAANHDEPPAGSLQAEGVIGPSASRRSTSGRRVASKAGRSGSVARQGRVGAARLREPPGEGDQRGVGGAPDKNAVVALSARRHCLPG